MEFLIKTKSFGGLTEEQFFHFCQENHSIKFERSANGEIIIMAPTGSDTGAFNLGISSKLYFWSVESKLGIAFDSNTGFTLPNGAVRSPDAAFIYKDEWKRVTPSDRKKFAHICPDFVIELLSESDEERATKEKMKEWIENGCSLAWMINPVKKLTTIYRKDGSIETLPFSTVLNGENILPGFFLDLSKIFQEEN